MDQELLKSTDLMLMSTNAWKEFLEIEPDWFSNVPSVLSLRK